MKDQAQYVVVSLFGFALAAAYALLVYERWLRRRPVCAFCGNKNKQDLIASADGKWVCFDWQNCRGVVLQEF